MERNIHFWKHNRNDWLCELMCFYFFVCLLFIRWNQSQCWRWLISFSCSDLIESTILWLSFQLLTIAKMDNLVVSDFWNNHLTDFINKILKIRQQKYTPESDSDSKTKNSFLFQKQKKGKIQFILDFISQIDLLNTHSAHILKVQNKEQFSKNITLWMKRNSYLSFNESLFQTTN